MQLQAIQLQAIQLPAMPLETPGQGSESKLATSNVAGRTANILQQQFLAQVLKILANNGTNNGTADVKILKTRQIIQLQPSIPLSKGQLVLLQQTEGGISLQTDARATAEQLMRLLIPRQGSVKDALSSLVRNLTETESPNPTRKDNLRNENTRFEIAKYENARYENARRENVSNLIKSVIKNLPSRQEVVNPELLKLFIKSSGLLPQAVDHKSLRPLAVPSSLPTTKANTGFMPRTPFGQLLLTILKTLLRLSPAQSNPAQVEQTAGLTDALSRILLNQIRPFTLADGDHVEASRLELIARQDNQLDSFQIQFVAPRVLPDRESADQTSKAQNTSDTEKKWTVQLGFDFPELGKVTAFIILAGDTRLELNFWIDRPGTFALIKSQRRKLQQKLQKRLNAQGIESLKIDVFEGEVPCQKPLATANLINEMA